MRKFFVVAALCLFLIGTALSSSKAQCLNGTYSVGANSNYETVKLAIQALVEHGVCGPVIFSIKDGVYQGNLLIPVILGASQTNTITFVSESLSASKVKITSNTGSSTMLDIQSSAHLKFQHLTFFTNNSTGQNVRVKNSSYIEFSNSVFTSLPVYSNPQLSIHNAGLPASPSQFINVTNCIFSFGSSAISTSSVSHITIDGNIVHNSKFAFALQDTPNSLVTNNYVLLDIEDAGAAIYLANSSENTVVANNEVILRNCKNCFALSLQSVSVKVPTEFLTIANNIFNVRKSATLQSAVRFYGSTNVNFVFNTVALGYGSSETFPQSAAIYIDQSQRFDLRNNILVNYSGGYALKQYHTSSTAPWTSDYNNLYTKGANLVSARSTNVASLQIWKQYGYDLHSVSLIPDFVSHDNLRVINVDGLQNGGIQIAGITQDIDGISRSSSPDIGASEFEGLSPTAVDAAISVPPLNHETYCYGWHPVQVLLKNSGTVPLTSATIITHVAEKEYITNWTGNLSSNESEIVNGAEHYFTDRFYKINIALQYVNGMPDLNPSNNVQSFALSIKDKPLISLSGSPDICDGEIVTLSANTPSANWSNGSVTTSISAGTAGQYWYDYIVNGCSSRSDSITMTVNFNLPEVQVDLKAIGQELQIKNNSVNATSYTWNYNDGTSGSGASIEQLHQFENPGTYNISFTGDNGECKNTKTYAVVIDDLATTTCLITDVRAKLIKEIGEFIYVGGQSKFDPSSALIYKLDRNTKAIIWQWQYNTSDGSNGTDVVKDIDVDSHGNVWATLYSSFLYNRLIKISSTGVLLFEKRVRSYSSDDTGPIGAAVVKVGTDDAVYFVNTRSTYTIEKLSSTGVSIWLREFPTGKSAFVHDAMMDVDGNMVVIASELLPQGDQLTITKYNANGNLIYSRLLDERTYSDTDFRITMSIKNGYIYVFGINYLNKTFVKKINSTGNVVWSHKLSETVAPYSHAVDSKDNLLMLYGKESSIVVRKIDFNGSLLFEKVAAQNLTGTNSTFCLDDNDYIYIVKRRLLVKLSPQGNLVYTEPNDLIPAVKFAFISSTRNEILIAGDISYPDCGVSRIIQTEHRKLQTIQVSQGALSGKYGSTIPFSGISSASLPVDYKIDDENIAGIENEFVKLKNVGETLLSVSQPGNEEFLPATLMIVPVIVSKADLLVLANDNLKVYGEDNPTFSRSITGFVNGDTESDLDELPVISTSAEKFTNVGTYDITFEGGLDDRYNFVFEIGKLQINKAPLQFTPNNQTKLYGDVNPDYTYTITGFLNDDDINDVDSPPVFSTSADALSDAGEYLISGNDGLDNNYEFELETATLTIQKALLTVTANHATKTYGQPNPDLSFSVEGFVGNDNIDEIDLLPAFSTSADVLSGAGEYLISGNGGLDNNYEFELGRAKLTIQKALLTVTANYAIKTYGQPNPDLSFSVEGFVGSDDIDDLEVLPAFSTSADVLSDAGEYLISGNGGLDNNYEFELGAATLTIQKALLTVTANHASKTYGQPNPDLSFSIEGFVGNDDGSNLDEYPIISTSATVYSNAGSYDITCSNGFDNNYTFEYRAGSLTVNKASQVISFPEVPDRLLSDRSFIATATASSGLPVTFLTTSPLIQIEGDVVQLIDIGDAEMSAIQQGDENFLPAESVNRQFNIMMITDIEQRLNPFQVFPNPASSELNIETSENNTEATLLNISGVVLNSKLLTKGSNKIDLASLPAGVYMLKITSKTNVSYYVRIQKVE